MKQVGGVLGYARVSTADQDLSGQITCLKDAGAIRVFEDIASGKQFYRLDLSALIDQARPGDSLAIVRLDRVGYSLKELLETVENLKDQEIGLSASKNESTRHPQPGNRSPMSSEPSRTLNGALFQSARKTASKPPERRVESLDDRRSRPKPFWL